MYIIEHALLNIVRNKGRNILLGVIIFAIITAAVVTLAIFNTTGTILEETRHALERDDAAFQNAIGSISNLQSLMLTFLIIVLVLGAVLMTLLSVIVIRERRYEIGVLRAMGMDKKKIALGLWVEILTITCICFALGLGAGTMVSQPVSDMILTGQTSSTSAGSTSLAERLNITTETEEPIIVNVSVSPATAMQILGVSILLASISGFISASRINKCEPIKILAERA